ncbi:Hypothetical_protein [Hexamita inflata]|uniref:Hypothetical_protein n=1 Tax=Hexamita inflata TaxID=28002 RepID=A0AA86QDY4_9EUKA|nr:Hypothetical protein HINF_LOCUS38992 [Hexamita inflata]
MHQFIIFTLTFIFTLIIPLLKYRHPQYNLYFLKIVEKYVISIHFIRKTHLFTQPLRVPYTRKNKFLRVLRAIQQPLECGSKLAFNEIICIDSYKVVKQHQISGNILGLQAQQDPNRLFVLRNEILPNQFKKFKHLTEAEQTVETCDLTLTVLADDLTQMSHSVYAMNDFPFELAQEQVHDEIKQILFINGQPSAYVSNIQESVMRLTLFYLSQLIGQKVNIKSLTCENAFWRAGLDRFAVKFQLDYKDGAIVIKNPQTLFRELKLPRSSYHLIDFCANGALYEKVHEDVSDDEEEQEEKEELMWIAEFRKEGRQPIEGISVDIAV